MNEHARSRVLIMGASGHGKVILDAAQSTGLYEVVGFLDDRCAAIPQWQGLPVLGSLKDLQRITQEHSIRGGFVAVGDNHQRATIQKQIQIENPSFTFFGLIHAAAIVSADVRLGAGSVILAGCVVQPGCQIGDGCILNTRSSLDHDNVMEDFASLGPSACTGGNVHIGTECAIGIGAVIRHGLQMGAYAVIGAGAVVLHSVADFTVSYGTPARPIRTRTPEDPYL